MTDLRVSFEPEAIREHFEESDLVVNLTDDELRAVGEYALGSDSLWRLFHELLVEGVKEEVWKS